MSKVLGGVMLAGVLALVMFQVARRQPRVVGPEEVVFKMIGSARAGDLEGYLDCFCGEIREKLSRQVEREGAGGVAEDLRRSTKDLAGVCVTGSTPGAYGEVELDVEFVFPTRTERQRLRLVEQGREWRVSDLPGAQYTKPVERYGSRVESLFPYSGEER